MTVTLVMDIMTYQIFIVVSLLCVFAGTVYYLDVMLIGYLENDVIDVDYMEFVDNVRPANTQFWLKLSFERLSFLIIQSTVFHCHV